jgi:hypothetical protein
MSEPRRILDGQTSQFERDLLESWSSEQPSAASRARALAIAGAAAGTLAAAATATAAAASTSASASMTGTGMGMGGVGAAAGVAAPNAAGVGLAVTVKWGLLFAFVAASVVAGVVVLGGSPSSDAPPSPAPAPVTTAATATATRTGTAAAATTAEPGNPPAPTLEPKTVSPSDLPPATAGAATTPPPGARAPAATATVAAPAAPSAESSLSEEIASFDRARAAFDTGDSDRALALVDAYERRFPAGTFVQEAEVLRVQALGRKGDTAGARRAGQRFLAAHPTSPHAARIRAILDSSSP